MPDKKLTDSEIVKALECCKKDDCDNCPNDFGNCYANLAGYALDLINRLQAENERLKKENHWFADIGKLYSEIKAETYKECIEKVKALFPSDNEPYQYWEIHEGVDNLLKELVGEDK